MDDGRLNDHMTRDASRHGTLACCQPEETLRWSARSAHCARFLLVRTSVGRALPTAAAAHASIGTAIERISLEPALIVLLVGALISRANVGSRLTTLQAIVAVPGVAEASPQVGSISNGRRNRRAARLVFLSTSIAPLRRRASRTTRGSRRDQSHRAGESSQAGTCAASELEALRIPARIVPVRV